MQKCRRPVRARRQGTSAPSAGTPKFRQAAPTAPAYHLGDAKSYVEIPMYYTEFPMYYVGTPKYYVETPIYDLGKSVADTVRPTSRVRRFTSLARRPDDIFDVSNKKTAFRLCP